MGFKVCALLMAITMAVTATPTGNFWKSTSFEEVRALCDQDDTLACIQYRAMSFVDDFLRKDTYQIGEDVQVTRNGRMIEETARTAATWTDMVESYIREHDVTFNIPMMGSKLTVGGRNLDADELDVKVEFEARRSKLKKVFVPILVFVLLKAITLIPLALGVLGLKAWNALQLSFFSFVVSVSLAIFQLCKKIAADGAHPQITAHSPWEPIGHYAGRSLPDIDNNVAQQLAYSAHME